MTLRSGAKQQEFLVMQPARRAAEQLRGNMAKQKKKQPKSRSARHYPRTARLNTLLHRIVAEYLDRIEQDDLGLVTITGVEVDNDLNVAEVFISTLDDVEDSERDEEILEALAEHRIPIKRAIASEAQLRKTPEVIFNFDPAVRSSNRLDSILKEINQVDAARQSEQGEVEDQAGQD